MKNRNKIIFTSLIAFAVLSAIPAIDQVYAEDSKIPAWVQGVFGFYADGNIGDDELIQGLQFLISNGVIDVGSSEVVETESVDVSQYQSKITELENTIAINHEIHEDTLKKLAFAQSDRNEQESMRKQAEANYRELDAYAGNLYDENVELKEKIAELEKQIEELQNQ